MIAYLVNFVLCSGVLLLVYRLFLRNENLYKFNRFYLLFGLVFSLIVPFMTIHVPRVQLPGQQFNKQVSTTIIPPAARPVINKTTSVVLNTTIYQQEGPVIAPANISTPVPQHLLGLQPLDYLPQGLIILYLTAVIVLLVRFIRNSYRISRSVSQSTVINYHDTSVVLVDEEVTPHSFLKYVFINKKDYNDGSIEPEIICHEQAHVRQLHSLDVIFVELMQVLCWFNPFIPFYRRAIKLNHEFLADDAVIKNYDNTPAYQFLLLTKATQSGGLQLASPFNYLTTKKRLIMMSKHTSAKIALLKQLAIVPVLAAVVLLFSHKVLGQGASAKSASKTTAITNQDQVQNEPIKVVFNGKPVPFAKTDASQSIVDEFAAILKKYGIPAGLNNHLQKSPKISPVDNERLERLYMQMSKAQQKDQWVSFMQPFPPPAKLRPTAEQLATWQADPVKYGVYIDGKRIVNADLANYKPEDFDLLQYSRIMPNAVKLNKCLFSANLLTPAAYDKFRKEMLSKKDWQMWMKMKPDAKPLATQHADRTKPKIGNAIITKSAKQGAPQSILDEYAAILEKYKQTDPKSLMPHRKFSDADRDRLETLYKQMNDDQQRHQWLWFIPRSELVISKTQPPTVGQLIKWQDAINYGVWINDKRIKNTELSKYKPSDFEYVAFSNLSKRAAKDDGFHYQIDLMTKDYLGNYNKEELAKKDWKVVHNGKGPVKGYYRKS